jgi:hypothetical protein
MRRIFASGLIYLIYVILWVMAAVTAPFHWFTDRRRERNSPPVEPQPSRCFRVDPYVSTLGEVSMKRAVGYCENTDCEDFAKGVFLLNHGNTFFCPRCREEGNTKPEVGSYTGGTDVFKEVRVEYNYDPLNDKYREIAIVRDESLWGTCNVYTLKSPLIKTEKRGLKVAEAILANLNRYRGLLDGDGIPRTTEWLLSFDDPTEEFNSKLLKLRESWENSDLTARNREVVKEKAFLET